MTLMTPSEALVETLRAQGVRHVFGIVGSALWTLSIFLSLLAFALFQQRMNKPLGIWADAYARAGDSHGVYIAQNGLKMAQVLRILLLPLQLPTGLTRLWCA